MEEEITHLVSKLKTDPLIKDKHKDQLVLYFKDNFEKICKEHFENHKFEKEVNCFIKFPNVDIDVTQEIEENLFQIGIYKENEAWKAQFEDLYQILDEIKDLERRKFHLRNQERQLKLVDTLIIQSFNSKSSFSQIEIEFKEFVEKYKKNIGTHGFFKSIHIFYEKSSVLIELEWVLEKFIFTQSGGDEFLQESIPLLSKIFYFKNFDSDSCTLILKISSNDFGKLIQHLPKKEKLELNPSGKFIEKKRDLNEILKLLKF